jgi:hypothetical protein
MSLRASHAIFLFAFAPGLLASAASGCSSPSSGGPSCTTYDPGSIDLQNPKVSFKNDVVIGVFNKSCGLSTSCHGSATSSQQGLFLGDKNKAGADSSAVRTGIVGVKATEIASMPVVTAGDPKTSYLMHKMDGDNCTLNAQCVGGDCQSTMPQGVDLLPPENRDVVRRWIAQGAQDN